MQNSSERGQDTTAAALCKQEALTAQPCSWEQLSLEGRQGKQGVHPGAAPGHILKREFGSSLQDFVLHTVPGGEQFAGTFPSGTSLVSGLAGTHLS